MAEINFQNDYINIWSKFKNVINISKESINQKKKYQNICDEVGGLE